MISIKDLNFSREFLISKVDDDASKRHTFVIGNHGADIWVEKLLCNRNMTFLGRNGCILHQENDGNKNHMIGMSFVKVASALIPGISMPSCQSKIPLKFRPDDSSKPEPIFNYKDPQCDFFVNF